MESRFMANRFENDKYIIEYYPVESTVEFMMKNLEIEKKDIVEMHKVVLGFTQTRNYATLFRAMDFFSIASEARIEGSKRHYSAFVSVQAFVVKNMAQKLIGTFIMKFNTPVRETKLCSTYEEARTWIKSKVGVDEKGDQIKSKGLSIPA